MNFCLQLLFFSLCSGDTIKYHPLTQILRGTIFLKKIMPTFEITVQHNNYPTLKIEEGVKLDNPAIYKIKLLEQGQKTLKIRISTGAPISEFHTINIYEICPIEKKPKQEDECIVSNWQVLSSGTDGKNASTKPNEKYVVDEEDVQMKENNSWEEEQTQTRNELQEIQAKISEKTKAIETANLKLSELYKQYEIVDTNIRQFLVGEYKAGRLKIY